MVAFRQLYEKYQPRLSRYLTAFCEPDLADDIMQEVFVKFWLRREMLTGITVPELYLQRMARNRWLDIKKAENIRLKHETGFSRTAPLATEGITDNIQYGEFHQLANHALQQMPERRRQLLQLSIFHGYSLSEIASLTGLSKAVVKKQLYLANQFLRNYMREHGDISLLLIWFMMQSSK